MNSTEILKALDEIGATSSVTAKTALLSAYLKDEDFYLVCKYALDPFITYGQRPSKADCEPGDDDWDGKTWDLLEELKNRALTGTAAIQRIQHEYAVLNGESAELLWRVINKDLRGGFGKTLCLKLQKDMFQSFPYMRCSLPSDTDLEKWAWNSGIISQKKADGMFVNVNNESGVPRLLTRQGELVPEKGFENIYKAVAAMQADTQSHGEIEVIDSDGDICPREIGNGMINHVQAGGDWEPGYRPVLKVWDQIPLSEVQRKGKYKVAYIDRLRSLNQQVREVQGLTDIGNFHSIHMIETRIVRSLAEAYRHYVEILKDGGEGTVVKKPTMIWADGTSKDQIKLKLEARCELRIKGFKEGKEGKKTSKTFGSLALESECGELAVNCSGMDDKTREDINADREAYLEVIVSVTFNGIMYAKKKGKKHSLFLPRLDEIRHDRNTADTFERVVQQVQDAISLIEAKALAQQ